MLKLNLNGLNSPDEWASADIKLPGFDIEKMLIATRKAPRWVHFGTGNIFRGYIAMLAHALLERGESETGIIAVAPYDSEIIDRIYRPHDNLTLRVIMNPDGTLDKNVVASVSEALISSDINDWERLKEIFISPQLQMVSFTITEKGYSLYGADSSILPEVYEDIYINHRHPRHIMPQLTALLLCRYKSGGHPIALVSMDNCSHNGDVLRNAVLAIARKWTGNGIIEKEFIEFLSDEKTVAFPWSMIDKITPRPSREIGDELKKSGFEPVDIIETSKHTFIAPFVNAERPEYLVIEDSFPNGRPPLESAGVLFADRATVEKAENMKVSTCLNPQHTALAIFGCLLRFVKISDEMKDPCLSRLVYRLGYEEGMPVVADPGIIKPEEFIAEVLKERLPNPNIPDTPQRIATDTSQKLGVRFGQTLKAYVRDRRDVSGLTIIPLVIAGWCRYLLGVDDTGSKMPLSPDPRLEQLRAAVSGIVLGNPQPDKLRIILSDRAVFGADLYEIGLGEKIEGMFAELTEGPGAVRRTLQKYLCE